MTNTQHTHKNVNKESSSQKQKSKTKAKKLDQTLDASFPASDPPSFTPGTATSTKVEGNKISTKQVLIRLNDTDLTLADDELDIRGYDVESLDGKELGNVNDLLVTQDTKQVRFLEITTGGFLGIGEKVMMVPVEVIKHVANEKVTISKAGHVMRNAPTYDPSLVKDETKTWDHWSEVYHWYGHPPM